LITGISGSCSFNTDRIDHPCQHPHEGGARMHLHYGDLTATNLVRVMQSVQPDEIYNLAAQSHVAVSFEALRASCSIRAA
jgi:GDPmannose 4,6-dehydratase